MTDPYAAEVGKLGRPSADIVTISHEHPGHNNAEGVAVEGRVLRGPGEYDVRGVAITGVQTAHDAAEGRERGWVSTMLGRRRYLPDLRSNNPVARNAAERMAMNAPVQGTASDMIKIAMVRVHAALRERGLQARMLLQVHDELLFEAPPAEVPEVEALARELMEGALPLDVPIVVDVKSGLDWSHV